MLELIRVNNNVYESIRKLTPSQAKNYQLKSSDEVIIRTRTSPKAYLVCVKIKEMEVTK